MTTNPPAGPETHGSEQTKAERLIDRMLERSGYDAEGPLQTLATLIVEAEEALTYIVDEPPNPEFPAIEGRLAPILWHWSHTGPQDREYLRCPRCLVDQVLARLRGVIGE